MKVRFSHASSATGTSKKHSSIRAAQSQGLHPVNVGLGDADAGRVDCKADALCTVVVPEQNGSGVHGPPLSHRSGPAQALQNGPGHPVRKFRLHFVHCFPEFRLDFVHCSGSGTARFRCGFVHLLRDFRLGFVRETNRFCPPVLRLFPGWDGVHLSQISCVSAGQIHDT